MTTKGNFGDKRGAKSDLDLALSAQVPLVI